jgi:uncharacterized protein (TIGR02145 family)
MKKTAFLGFTALWFGLSMLSAQVTIGEDQLPQNFSILELVSDNTKGLRLPQMTSHVRDSLTVEFTTATNLTAAQKLLAMGLQIFNTTDKSVETWNGRKWISIGAEPQYAKCTVKSTLRPEGLSFMCYNLGAVNKTIAEQQAYNSINAMDATVYGDLYQWGRMADGHQIRSNPAVAGPYSGPFDANGQIPGSEITYCGHFVYTGSGDWRTPQDDHLWGKPKTAGDPCPAGWRVPTADEWNSIFMGGPGSLGIYTSWNFTTSGNCFRYRNGNTPGLEISSDNGATVALFLPTAGWREKTNGVPIVFSAFYLSSTAISGTVDIYHLSFDSNNIYFGGSGVSGRSTGYSVRCIEEY